MKSDFREELLVNAGLDKVQTLLAHNFRRMQSRRRPFRKGNDVRAPR